MSKIYLEIVNWPDGYGLTISDETGNNCYAIAGTHGGGVGKTLKRFGDIIDVTLSIGYTD